MTMLPENIDKEMKLTGRSRSSAASAAGAKIAAGASRAERKHQRAETGAQHQKQCENSIDEFVFFPVRHRVEAPIPSES